MDLVSLVLSISTQAQYRADLGPSQAWVTADRAERQVAERAYLGEYGSWNNGCKADLAHAYQGTTKPPYFKASHVQNTVWLGAFVPGVCG